MARSSELRSGGNAALIHDDVAGNLERQYRWYDASERYLKLAKDARRSKERQEEAFSLYMSARCCLRAATQSKSRDRYLQVLGQASDRFGEAARVAEGTGGQRGPASSCLFNAASSVARSFLAPGPVARKELLVTCERTATTALESFDRLGDIDWALRACSLLLQAMNSELNLEWDKSRRLEISRRALRQSERVDPSLFAGEDRREVVSFYLLNSMLRGTASSLYSDSSQRDAARQDALGYAHHALDEAIAAGDDLLKARSVLNSLQLTGITRASRESYHAELQKAEEYALASGDEEVIADVLLNKGVDQTWNMAAEEDPLKKASYCSGCTELANQAIEKYLTFSNLEGASDAYGIVMAQGYYRLALSYAELSARRPFLAKAADLGRKAVGYYRESGAVGDDTPAHTLMMTLYELSKTEADAGSRRGILEEALSLREEVERHRENVTPYHSWNRGVTAFYVSQVQAELAELEADQEKRLSGLLEASRGVEQAVRLCEVHYQPPVEMPPRVAVGIGTYAGKLASLLQELYLANSSEDLRQRLIWANAESAELFRRGGWMTRAAEAHWGTGQFLSRLKDHPGARHQYELAAQMYGEGTSRVPEFRSFFLEYSTYMQAWAEIEQAWQDSDLEDYTSSSFRLQKAAELLRATERWRELYDYFLAWSKLQDAEEAARSRRPSESSRTFSEAARSFSTSAQNLQGKLEQSTDPREKEELLAMSSAATLRMRYAEARALVEVAKDSAMAGDRARSSLEFGRAADALEGLSSYVDRTEREGIDALAQLCHGLQLMARAEEQLRASAYSEAAEALSWAAEHTTTKGTSFLASANSCYCRAMYFGLKFRETGETDFYSKAKVQLESAQRYFVSCGDEVGADWVETTGLLLDAYTYTLRAESAGDPAMKGQLYRSAEQCLEVATKLCLKSNHKERLAEIEGDLDRLRRRTDLATTMAQVFAVPPPTSPAIAMRLPSGEQPRGLDAFEGANILARLTCDREVEVGGTMELQIDLFNTGKVPAAAQKVEGLIPKGFKFLSNLPDAFTMEGSSLLLHGKSLEPMKIESLRVTLQAEEEGDVTFYPKLIYLDREGRPNFQNAEVTGVKVVPTPTFGFKSPLARAAFDCLVMAFKEDYMLKRLSMDQSGWRSFVEVAKMAGISPSTLYGRGGRHGPALYELVARGLVETRTFSGQRGRGGEIVRVRVAYEREPVKRHVDKAIMKTGES